MQSVLICNMREGIYYAEIIGCSEDQGSVRIDARPSDAIAIALRFKIPIYITEKVFSEGSIEMEPLEDLREEVSSQQNRSVPSVKRLEEMLEEALRAEDYERAAQIRDEIKKMA